MRVTSFAFGENISKIFKTTVTIIQSDTQEVYLGEENIIVAADVFLAVKTLKLEIQKVVMKSDPKWKNA